MPKLTDTNKKQTLVNKFPRSYRNTSLSLKKKKKFSCYKYLLYFERRQKMKVTLKNKTVDYVISEIVLFNELFDSLVWY